jgi:sRNA-binding protein
MEAEIAKRKKAVDAAVRSAALAAADLDGLRAKSATVGDLTTAEAEARALKTKLSDAYQEWARKPTPAIPEAPLSCPHCGCDVAIEDGKLVAASHAPDDADIAAATAARAEHDVGKEAAKKSFEDACEDHKPVETALSEAKAAAKKLAELGEVGGNVTEADVEKARLGLSQAERALTAIKQKAEADRLHRQVEASQLLIDLLAPDGIRKTRLANVLTSFAESRLLPLSKAAGYQPVTIGQDMEIRYGGRLAREPFVSESQAMRARIILQVGMAQLDQSECILIDKGDKLDKRGRDGLFALLAASGVKAVVAMTMSRPDRMPDLLGAKMGESYWLDRGVTTARAQALEPQHKAAE